MKSNDMHNCCRAVRGITPVAIGTTGTGKTSVIVDRQGYGGVEFIISVGSITATNATITPVLKEGDVTGTLTSVADADLLGTEALAGVAAAATRTSGVSKNCVRRLGYKGTKRYLSLQLVNTVTAGPIVSAEAILHNPFVAPTANP